MFPRISKAPSLYDRLIRLTSRCDAQHRCYDSNMGPGKTKLPTRVLDISRGATDIRLRETAGLDDRYICLSHCWGSKLPLSTTVDNLNKHRQNISWDAFPVVYKETIMISRKLGVKYVWIDSLCIIQDSKSDWARESKNMCDVYANTYLTVSATSSPNCSFSMMKPILYPLRVQFRVTRLKVDGSGRRQSHSLVCIEPTRCVHWDGPSLTSFERANV